MTIEIKALTLGIAATNCYIVGNTATNEALVIDAADRAELLLSVAKEAGWTIKLILATHGHFDHVLAVRALKEKTGAPFCIHERGSELLKVLPQQGIMFTGRPFPEAAIPDHRLSDSQEIVEIDGIRLETIYTPGHSPDHISFFLREQHILFCGDCLFAGSVGRVDLPGGNYEQLMRSIVEKLLPLGDDVQVLPGHMETTTLGQERQTNPFILDFLGT